MDIKKKLTGTGVAIVTPFTKEEEVDYAALDKLIDNIITKGVEYIVTLGTTGETPVLSPAEKKEIIKFTYEKVNARVPVIVGIGGNSTKELLHDIENYPLEKATAILSASPYYNKPSQEGLFLHYKAIAEAAPKPVILYNVPGRTGRNIEAATTIRLANEVNNIAGIKEASGDMLQCMEILRRCPPTFLVVSGDDALALPQLACGMDGVISVAANAFPADFSEMVRLCLNGKLSEARVINDRLIDAYDLMFRENNPAGIKGFLHEMGMLENIMRLPVVPLSGTLQMAVKKYLKM
jgi:4-hydroxy-tetrahydrodipicolinate synthase